MEQQDPNLSEQARRLAEDYAGVLDRVQSDPNRYLAASEQVRERLSRVLQRGPTTVWLVEEVARRCELRGNVADAAELYLRAAELRALDAS